MTTINKFKQYINLFLEENHKVNLISKNDEKLLWEKHIYDSLAMQHVIDKYGLPATLLDFGTGGGFPSVPLAIEYPEIKITAVDSIAKKIKAVETFKTKLDLKNLTPICARVENVKGEYDIVTSRAVSSFKNILELGLPKVKKGGYFIAYKSRKAKEEIEDAQHILKKFNAKVIDIIEYQLPLNENIERNLIITAL